MIMVIVMKAKEGKRSEGQKMEDKRTMGMLKTRLGAENYQKLSRIDNPELHQ